MNTSKMDRETKKLFVRQKFTSVTNRYDLLNTVLSLGIDHLWRIQTAKALSDIPPGPVLDLCAGTIPLSIVINRQIGRPVVALDFCLDMLIYGKERIKGARGEKEISFIQGDAEEIPAKERHFAGATIAFGLRNLADPQRGLFEMYRVLKPGGVLAILEFSRPQNPLFATPYFFYLEKILPIIGGIVSGDREAYEYLASSIKAFPPPQQVAKMMEKAGFNPISFRPMTFGIVHLYVGRRPA